MFKKSKMFLALKAIVGISTIGYVDVDGAKVSAIAVEYNVEFACV